MIISLNCFEAFCLPWNNPFIYCLVTLTPGRTKIAAPKIISWISRKNRALLEIKQHLGPKITAEFADNSDFQTHRGSHLTVECRFLELAPGLVITSAADLYLGQCTLVKQCCEKLGMSQNPWCKGPCAWESSICVFWVDVNGKSKRFMWLLWASSIVFYETFEGRCEITAF